MLLFHILLWMPYGLGQAIIFLPCGFFLLLLSFYLFCPRLISAATDWMSIILLHMACSTANLECRSENVLLTARCNYRTQKVAQNRHLGTIAQLRRAISSQLSSVGTNSIRNYLNTIDNSWEF